MTLGSKDPHQMLIEIAAMKRDAAERTLKGLRQKQTQLRRDARSAKAALFTPGAAPVYGAGSPTLWITHQQNRIACMEDAAKALDQDIADQKKRVAATLTACIMLAAETESAA